MSGKLVSRIWEYDPALYAPARYRKACRYEVFIPNVLANFNELISSEISGIVTEAETAIRALNSGATIALAPLARLLLRSESIASSKIEGAQVDARQIARAEARSDRGGKTGSVVQEVLGNINAMELAIDRASRTGAITVADIIEIHKVLMEPARNSHLAGLIRREQNWIGGNDYNPCEADFVPPPPEEVMGLLEDLCVAINEDHLSPVAQAGLVHAQFETIHPFYDGNGRTGRALIHVILRRRGVSPFYVPPISVVLSGRKDKYLEGLTKFRSGEFADWLSIFGQAAVESAHLATQYLQEVKKLQEDWKQSLSKASNPRSDAVAWRILELLPGYPIITTPVATAVTGRTKAVVGEGLKQLEAAGILSRLSGGAGAVAWESTELLNLISDFSL